MQEARAVRALTTIRSRAGADVEHQPLAGFGVAQRGRVVALVAEDEIVARVRAGDVGRDGVHALGLGAPGAEPTRDLRHEQVHVPIVAQ